MTDKIDDISCFLVRRKATNFISIFTTCFCVNFQILERVTFQWPNKQHQRPHHQKSHWESSFQVLFAARSNTGLATNMQAQRTWQRFLKCVALPFLLPLTCSSGRDVDAVPGGCEGSGGERRPQTELNEKLQSALPVKTSSEQLNNWIHLTVIGCETQLHKVD